MNSEVPELKPQQDWRPDSISQTYKVAARDAERSMHGCREKAKTQDVYEMLHDESAAFFYCYDYLHDKKFLDSPEQLWRRLHELSLNPPTPPSECFEKDRFTRYFLMIVHREKSKLESADDPNSTT